MKRIFTLLLGCVALSGFGQSSTVVISQFYSGGGSSSATVTYQNDYAELHNVSNTPQDISGFSLQYGSGTGNFGSSASNIFAFPAATILLPGQYLLVQLGTTGTGGAVLPVTPDFVTSNINAGAASGKIALVNSATALACGATATQCTLPSASIIDLVSYGVTTNAEGGDPVNDSVGLANNQMGVVRKNSGCQDTDNNNLDFDVITAPVPRNSGSPVVICSTLPLYLTSFKASLVNGNASLSWTSANELNVKGFSIEKSLNGTNFSEINFVQANNRSSNTYAATDINVKAGANYYRLKMIDKDGATRYSNVVVLTQRSTKAEVFPNPAISNLTVSHNKAERGAVIRILSLEGRQMKVISVQAGAQQTGLSVSDLVSGTYLLMFESNGEKVTTKFTKQ